METARSEPVGAALSRDISTLEKIEGELDHFIRLRHEKRVKEEGERAQEAAWAESARKHAAKRRLQSRAEWLLHHQHQSERLRRTLEALIAHHEAEASKLGPLGGEAA